MNAIRVQLFQAMADLTAPECATNCRIPHSCCDAMYCGMAEEYALEQGVVLAPAHYHPTLKFMGPTGCTVAPHLRPSCTLHTCAINGYGFKPGDSKWTEQYFALRNQIDSLD